ncbi:hypothetical protein [Corallococcus carmarthensis]|uniref:Uncharacterized protein n=1 Tax=Corallococcus carmarthensis TaxID=2316728 RepID=A0A3A8K7M0_9BACT|nr:hypothetical protein [Corallococcus carmarthensis]NOK17867.1 hypothetical protein [Corallococcus carmarthensis]RKG97763.1 hypothetical protein D7X32_31640 [Corallococcus carmarthensis]
MAEALNLLTVLAAPRLYARWRIQAPAEEMRTVLQSRMEALSSFCAKAWGSPDAERFRAAAPTVRKLGESIAAAPPSTLMDAGWNAQARECLDALGVPVPPGGWEAFEGLPPSSE